MNILFISHTAGAAGAETVLADSVRRVLAHTGHRVFVALPKDGNDAFIQLLGVASDQCTIAHFAYRPVRHTWLLALRNLGYGWLFGLWKLKRFIIRNDIDLVYVNSSVNVIGIWAAQQTKRPYIWHIHEQSTALHRWAPVGMRNWYVRRLSDSSCRSIFVSQISYQAWLEDLGVESIQASRVVYSAYHTPKPAGRANDPVFTFGFLGSLTANKNVERLIAAFKLMSNQDCRLIIAGDGPERGRLQAVCEGDTRIEFMGHVEQAQEFLDRIDALAIVSFNESWGLVVLEAMSASKPTIVTRNTGLVELFTDRKECLFVDPNSEVEIKAAMEKIASDAILRKRLVVNARNLLSSMEINESYTRAILDLIDETKA